MNGTDGRIQEGRTPGAAPKEPAPVHTFAVCAYGDSPYLEECLASLKRQSVPSEIICCTSTPSPYIRELTGRFRIPLYVRDKAEVSGKKENNIREDWLFAWRQASGRLVTIAHQDDIYRRDYAKELLRAWEAHPDLLVFVSDYLTLKMTEQGARPEPFSPVWLVKKLLRLPLRLTPLTGLRAVKRSSVLFGNALCCPACTYNKERIGDEMFSSDYEFALDWDNLYELAGRPGRFVCVEKPLLAYRVHAGAETSACIRDQRRAREELSMFQKMWPGWAARLLMHFYRNAYKEYQTEEEADSEGRPENG